MKFTITYYILLHHQYPFDRFYVFASILAILIPVIPIISLHIPHNKSFWNNEALESIPLAEHTTMYALLIFSGIWFLCGSLILVRCFQQPTPKPICSCSLLVTDEVFASWCFFCGVLPTVPLVAIYCHFIPDDRTFGLALFVCISASFAMLIFTLTIYPASEVNVSI